MFDIRCRLLSALYWKRTIPREWYYANQFFSEHGQDAILARLIGRDHGFYVDVGAHHPFYLSNTYLFHRMGWRGINIEPSPEGYAAFVKERASDINVQRMVLDREVEVDFHIYQCSEMNTCSPEMIRKNEALGLKPSKTIPLRAERLESILHAHLPERQKIDFLNVDCEGSDLVVLKSNDWDRFRPSWIMVEDFDFAAQSEITRYLEGQDYRLTAFWEIVKIFKDMSKNHEDC